MMKRPLGRRHRESPGRANALTYYIQVVAVCFYRMFHCRCDGEDSAHRKRFVRNSHTLSFRRYAHVLAEVLKKIRETS